MTKPSFPQATAETIACLVAIFHRHRDYGAFYERHTVKLRGFAGIWRFCLLAAHAFSEAEGTVLLPDDYNWIVAVDAFVNALICCKKLPSDKELRALAKRAIRS
ncbi:MAG: hypothetical protein IT461_16205 [Planctomycetes bacterium]|nr:hypothetical protein [Planctomycetota bacterium]